LNCSVIAHAVIAPLNLVLVPRIMVLYKFTYLLMYGLAYLLAYLLTGLLHDMCIQEILGGQYVAVEKYSAPFFQRFRSENIVQLTIDFARVSCFVLHQLFNMH